MANPLNMTIAKTHRLASRMIGMQMTSGSLIAIVLSALQMSIGFGMVANVKTGTAWMDVSLHIGLYLIGIAMAILVERLSLGGLASVRLKLAERKHINAVFFQLAEPTEHQKALFARRDKMLFREVATGWGIGIVGMVLSLSLGDNFWEHVFSAIDPWYVGVLLSFACASVIGLTFIHSELYKTLVDSILVDIVQDNFLMEVTVRSEGKNMQLDMMVEAYDEARNNKEVAAKGKEKVTQVIERDLTNYARNFSQQQPTQVVIESTLEGQPPVLMLPAPRGKYNQHRDELRRLLNANPNLSQRDIATHFNISRSTANEWHRKIRNGE